MFKICPEGHGEFQQRVTHCPDCGAALELATSTEPPPRAVVGLPPAHELTCIERGDPRALLEIAEHLQSAGVSCRIDAYPPDQPIRLGGRRGSGVATSFGLYVRPAEAEEATRLRTQHLEQTLPEATDYRVAAGTELNECPACGEPLAENARECAACGLEFPEAGSEP
jgi:uncharacterized protein with PIN domain